MFLIFTYKEVTGGTEPNNLYGFIPTEDDYIQEQSYCVRSACLYYNVLVPGK